MKRHPGATTMNDSLAASLRAGLAAPICLTWELTYGCNLSCRHCLSDSGSRAPGELNTDEALELIDTFAEMGIFYVNIGGGEPMMRRDFFPLLEHAVSRRVGVKFSTNGTFLDAAAARRLAGMDYVDVQVSIDGPDRATNDALRGRGSFAKAVAALENLATAGFDDPKISVVATRHNVSRLDELEEMARGFGASLRVTRLRPSGRGAQSYADLRPTPEDNRHLFRWLSERPHVLTGDSFFHLSPLGDPLPGLNMCGAGRVVCLVDPVGDVYACPFTIHPDFKAGNIRETGLADIWRSSDLFTSLRSEPGPTGCSSCSAYASCQGGCMAAKFHTGSGPADPDPECVMGRAGATASTVVSIRPRRAAVATR
ncbi:MAG: mycofactocin radical SAM maturase [Nitrospiraceae bacterium]|nr:mycofactocin radical SAM maturase [Nitrospiraceae bacterium]